MLDLSHFDLAPSRPRLSPLMTLAEVEHRHIQETLKATRGKIKGKGGAAELLGINPSTLYSRMRKHGFQHTPAPFKDDISSRKG
jgi:transcriptional regulator of acetoin/glycerol metabolism